MNRKRYYTLVVFSILFALVMAIVFMPVGTDTPLMYYYDKQYEKAYSDYKQRYESGERSIEVVIPLVDILIQYAKVDEAIALMEEYVTQNPNSADAHEYLAQIYRDSYHSYKYLEKLQDIYKIKPSLENLREQNKYFVYIVNYQGRISALEKIVASGEASEQELIDLSYNYYLDNQKDRAIVTLNELFYKYPIKNMDLTTVSFAIDLLGQKKLENKAVKIAQEYYQSHQSLQIAVELLQAFQAAELYSQGLVFHDALEKKIQEHPKVFLQRVFLLQDSGQNKTAYKLLAEKYNQGELPEKLRETYAISAIEFADPGTLKKLVSEEWFSLIPSHLILGVLVASAKKQDSSVKDVLEEVLFDEYLENHPAIAMALNNEVEVTISSLSTKEKIKLAELADIEDKKDLVVSLLKSIDHVSSEDASTLAFIFLEYDLLEHGKSLFDAAIKQSPDQWDLRRGWLILAAGLGQEKEVLDWMSKQSNLDEEPLIDAFYAAYYKKHASLSMHLANTSFQIYPKVKNQVLLAQAKILNGYPKEALDLMEGIVDQDPEFQKPYIEALIVVSKTDPSYEDQIIALLDKKSLKDNSLRDIGYLLIEQQQKKIAERAFLQLSDNKNYDSPDTQTLLSLWDENLDDEKLQLIAKRANGKDRPKWLRYLLWQEKPGYALSLIDRAEWDNEEIVDISVEALIMEKEKEELEVLIAYIIPQESRLPRLKKFGKLSSENGLQSVAKTIYRKVLEVDPNDAEGNFSLGELAYFEGDFASAYCLLQKAEDIKAAYYLGEISHFYHKRIDANHFYEKALEIDDLQIQAKIHYRKRFFHKAVKLYQEAYDEKPDNLYLAADFANTLIDLGYYCEAAKVLFQAKGKEGEEALKLAMLRYYMLTFSTQKALDLASALLEQYPESADVLAATAELNFFLKKWQKAVCYVNKARAIDPENVFYALNAFYIKQEIYPQVKLHAEYRETGFFQKERLASVDVLQPLGKGLYFEAFFEADRMKYIDQKVTRWHSDLSLTKQFWCGDVFTAALFFGDHVYGGGIEYQHPDATGTNVIVMEYHKPNWDFVQTIIDDGSLDLVGFKRLQRMTATLDAEFGFSFNRYNLRGVEEAATTWGLEGAATWRLPEQILLLEILQDRSSLSLNYYLESERAFYIKEIDGVQPLPFINYETHSGIIFASKEFSKNFTMEGYGGWTWDRIKKGKSVPVYGTNLLFGTRSCLEAKAVYSHSTSTDNIGESVDRYFLDVNYRW